MENEIKITTAINLEDYKKNSLLIAKIDPDLLKSQESIDALRRTMDDLRKKVNLDDSTTLFLTPEEFDVKAFDEEEMREMGWERSKKINELRKVVGLLNSMVLGGEKHSAVSEKMVRDVMD